MPTRRAIVVISLFFLSLGGASGGEAVSGGVHGGEAAPQGVLAARAVVDADRLEGIERLVTDAIDDRRLAGAVVLVGTRQGVVYQRAIGHRAVEPDLEPMTLDTIFDLASLTKVVATTTSVMALVEDGRIRLSDRVADHLPGFERRGKDRVTVGQLLVHMSGLRPDLDLAAPWVGYDTAIELAFDEVLVAEPGERFIYSDINFFLLGEIVARVAGMPLDRFAATRVFEPLGMDDTTFNPGETLRGRIAPTEPCSAYGWPCDGPDAVMLRGTVHDPTARRMQGVAGHAGLFSTARDLAAFCRMLLGGGAVDGVRVLSPLTVSRMTSRATPAREPNRRGLGWDVSSMFSANQGELFPPGSFGHTGFTGTSLWIDPASGVFVVFLSSRLHPDGSGNVVALRARTSTLVASAVTSVDGAALAAADWAVRNRWLRGAAGQPSAPPAGSTRTGIDVLRAEGFERLAGLRVGLLTNHTGRARTGESTIDLLHGAPGVELAALFSPEHGIRGVLDASVPSSTDARTGLPIHSLYGDTRRPSADQLEGLDAVVIDIQDVGARFYTYATSMAYMMEEAARAGVRVIVLDRPNPINGADVEGPVLDEGGESFTAYFRMPIRHGMTLGELATLFNDEAAIGARLDVVEMTGWRRDYWFDQTGLAWVDPSPNMRSLTQATLYPGIGAIETTNISVGRGTSSPFERVGAPWIDGVRLAAALNERDLPGVRFHPVTFTPDASRYAGVECHGVAMVVVDREAMRPVRVGVEIASALERLHGSAFELERASVLVRSAETLRRIGLGHDPAAIAASWSGDEAAWRRLRAGYLLYR